MCLLAIFFRAFDDAPLVLGANREEIYARPASGPTLLAEPAAVVAGVDSLAGGAWLGVNAQGVAIAITNRPLATPRSQTRSRGMLVRDLLGQPNARAAVEQATRELSTNHYAGCNLLCADAERCVLLEGAEWLRVRPLPPGLHVVANGELNDGSDRRVGHTLWWLAERNPATSTRCLTVLQNLCSQDGTNGPPISLHGANKGTVSSTLLAVRKSLSKSTLLHASGPPDKTPYDDHSALLRELAYSRGS